MRNYAIVGPPRHTCLEDLLNKGYAAAPYGEYVLAAVYSHPGYYGILYEFLSDDKTEEGDLGLVEVSDEDFEDLGHALVWASTAAAEASEGYAKQNISLRALDVNTDDLGYYGEEA